MKTIFDPMRCWVACLGGAVLMSTVNVTAVPTRLDTSPYIFPNTGVPGNPPNQGEGTVKDWLQALVDEYNLVNDPDLPAVVAPPAVSYTETASGVLSKTIDVSGYLYLTVHWGQGQTADHTQAWYLGGSLSSFTLTAPGPNGLSGYRLWNEVPRLPEAGATLLLLGVGLLATTGLARAKRC